MSSDPRSIRAARVASYRDLLSGLLCPADRAEIREKLDQQLRLVACDAPPTPEEINTAAVDALREKRGAAKRHPAPSPGLTPHD